MVIVEGEPRSLYLVLPRASVTVNVMRRRPRRQLSKERQNGALYCDLPATGRTDNAGITSRRTLLSSQGFDRFSCILPRGCPGVGGDLRRIGSLRCRKRSWAENTEQTGPARAQGRDARVKISVPASAFDAWNTKMLCSKLLEANVGA
jgi:hypothetical protein